MVAVMLLSACGTGVSVEPSATQVAIAVFTSTIEVPAEPPTIPASVTVPAIDPTGVPSIGVPKFPTPTTVQGYIKPTLPPGSPTIPIDPAKGPLVTGSVEIEQGIYGFDAPIGQSVDMLVMFKATMSGPVYGMRVNPRGYTGCATEADMDSVTWEILSLEQPYSAIVAPGLQKWYISAQYRDNSGNVSPIYCDDITIEGTVDTTGPITPIPDVSPVPPTLSGSVTIEEGKEMAGDVADSPISIKVQFAATGMMGGATRMRVGAGTAGCLSESDMETQPWEQFVAEKTYTTTTSIGIKGWYVSAQYQDQAGTRSLVYCDDISVEGMPPTPAP